MQPKKCFSPEAVTGGAATVITTTTVKVASNIPAKDIDFLYTAEAVSTQWSKTPVITLVWKTQAAFATDVLQLRTMLTQRSNSGSTRPQLTGTLKKLDKKANDAVTEVKVYIEKKFKKANAKVQFARYGIVKEGDGYRLPKDRKERLESFDLIKAAIVADGFKDEEFGTDFWTTLSTDYAATMALAAKADNSVNNSVSSKNQAKKKLTQVMTALLLVLKGNYPDTYKAVYREWGWKK